MHIKSLDVINFKNYKEVNLELHSKLNCFVGDNGTGKTNLLDAVYYLCMCKSYFQATDQYTINKGEKFMVLQADFILDEKPQNIYCSLKEGSKKVFRRNKKDYPRLIDHIGQFPVVMVSPADSALILDGSDERRKYLNSVISQYDREYLENVISYNKILAQRNRVLKENKKYSGQKDLLDIYDNQIVPLGTKIYNSRKEFVEKLSPVFKAFYNKISSGKEDISLIYNSQLDTMDFSRLLYDNLTKDLTLQYTSSGVHKDDLELLMNNVPIKKTGSQGQQKTFLSSLKLAQFKFIQETKNVTPILLLDDIFDKFDGNRVRQILHIVSDKEFGQIFITHTNELRMKELLKEFEGNFNLYKVEKENIKLLD